MLKKLSLLLLIISVKTREHEDEVSFFLPVGLHNSYLPQPDELPSLHICS